MWGGLLKNRFLPDLNFQLTSIKLIKGKISNGFLENTHYINTLKCENALFLFILFGCNLAYRIKLEDD